MNHFHLSSMGQIQSVLIPNGGDYLMKFAIGTPPVEFLAIADTGSDLIWTQCKPCEDCYKQDSQLFDPQQSVTYREMSCDTKYCQSLPNAECGNTSSECDYSYSYGDQSFSTGVLTSDTFTFDSTGGRTVAFPKIVFGCGHNNEGAFSSHESGIVGLGGGALSLASQLGSKIDGKFSYCLVPIFENSTSKLNFGSEAVISGEGAVSTSLVPKYPVTYYYLSLKGISVGNRQMTLSTSETNIIIDSGTTLTILISELYYKVESAIKDAINLDLVQDPSGTFSLCYGAKSDLKVPEMTFHFTGADLQLKSVNTFLQVSDDLVCLSMIPSKSSLSIFGNLAQMNFQVEYDLVKKEVSFAPADCTKY
ncbi:hypothetical protein HHK36_000565 [Tetracentron sinense]|uniref:Peptidase A1 domain-containing protein n=1 Tax=Tetracentron sinense TaxID=13715 RepID=A0A835A185_TETSI|nr:hypothetical protein HHK36_000565 [Tetracentron sinense]